MIFKQFRGIAWVDISGLKSKAALIDEKVPQKSLKEKKPKEKVPQAYIDLLDQRRYSASTKSTYTNYFADFLFKIFTSLLIFRP